MLLDAPTLICFSGLPGVGKTTIAKLLASILKTPYLRIDTIEQAILKSSIKPNDIGDAGYQVAYSIAKDNLASKQSIISDSVNPYMTIRDRWLTIVQETKARIIEPDECIRIITRNLCR